MQRFTGFQPATLTVMTVLLLLGLAPAFAGGSISVTSAPSHTREYSLDMGVSLSPNGRCSGNILLHHNMRVTVGAVHDIVSSSHITSVALDAAGNVHIQASGWESQWTAADGANRAPNGTFTLDITEQGDSYRIRVAFTPDDRSAPATTWEFLYPHDTIHIRKS